jgi:hypothetical protein
MESYQLSLRVIVSEINFGWEEARRREMRRRNKKMKNVLWRVRRTIQLGS